MRDLSSPSICEEHEFRAISTNMPARNRLHEIRAIKCQPAIKNSILVDSGL